MNMLKSFIRHLRLFFKLTQMHQVVSKLEKKDIEIHNLNAIEVFGGNGEIHTLAYAKQVNSLDVWEINSEYEIKLKNNLPNANIVITDSYEEMKKTNKKYDLIVIDNPMSTYGLHCEHFNLFPGVLRISENKAIIILNIIPNINSYAQNRYKNIFNDIQLTKRKEFYKTDNPEIIPTEHMIKVYDKILVESGFQLDWYFTHKRKKNNKNNFIFYLVLYIIKVEQNIIIN